MQKTKIEYLTHTWNPITMHCTPVSDGCDNCWHRSMAKRLAGNPVLMDYKRDAYAGKTGPVLYLRELEAPTRLKKPARIGVQFMGDLFHESVPFEHQTRIVSTIAECRQHMFLILTKRPEAMSAFFTRHQVHEVPCKSQIREMIRSRINTDTDSPYMFVNPRATGDGRRYNLDSLNLILKKAVAAAGVKPIKLYNFMKHTACTHFIEGCWSDDVEPGTVEELQMLTDLTPEAEKHYREITLNRKRRIMEGKNVLQFHRRSK